MRRVVTRENCPKCGAVSQLVTTLIYTTAVQTADLIGVEMHCLTCDYAREYHVGPWSPDAEAPDH
jgi:predicted nucleic-acid-binding Zn-ribbon protein